MCLQLDFCSDYSLLNSWFLIYFYPQRNGCLKCICIVDKNCLEFTLTSSNLSATPVPTTITIIIAAALE